MPYVRVVKPWNSLPEDKVTASSVRVFELKPDMINFGSTSQSSLTLERSSEPESTILANRITAPCIQNTHDDDDDNDDDDDHHRLARIIIGRILLRIYSIRLQFFVIFTASSISCRYHFKNIIITSAKCSCYNLRSAISNNHIMSLAVIYNIVLLVDIFSWPCLHQWLETRPNRPMCPVCKAGISKDKVIPLYGRGNVNQQDPRFVLWHPLICYQCQILVA